MYFATVIGETGRIAVREADIGYRDVEKIAEGRPAVAPLPANLQEVVGLSADHFMLETNLWSLNRQNDFI